MRKIMKANIELDDMQKCSSEVMNFMANKSIAADIDVARLMYYISPHRYGMNNIYGHNDLSQMLHDDVVSIKNWPSPTVTKVPFTSVYANSKSAANFYLDLASQMEHDYAKKMLDEGIMFSYETIVEKTNLIDITSVCKCNNGSRTDIPDFDFEEKTIKFLRTHNWYSFIPCFGECTFKVNRKRYINVKLIQIDEKERIIAIIVSDYSGDKYDWILHAKAVAELSFPVDSDGNVNLNFDIPINNTYEELLMIYVDKMKWSDKHKRFWYDLFSLSPIEKHVAVDLILPEDFRDRLRERGYGISTNNTENRLTTLLSDMTQTQFLKNVFGIKSEIICHGEEAVQPLIDDCANMLTVLYLNLVALANISLFSEPRIEQENTSSDGRQTYKFGKITIKSDTLPVIPSNKHVVKPIKGKELVVKMRP